MDADSPRVSVVTHAPRFDLADAVRFARDVYGLDASASILPSERDQNFLLTTATGDRYVLKIANRTESRAMLDAQNAAMQHVARRGVTCCQQVLPAVTGESIAIAEGGHLVRLVTYLEGVPLAEVAPRTSELLDRFGRTLGRLDAALADFDHPAIHREFHWDVASAARVVDEHLPSIRDGELRALVQRASRDALDWIAPRCAAFRRSAIHNDANDWNVLVSSNPEALIPNPYTISVIDFGDMLHSWTVADPAVACAYAILDAANPLDTAAAIVRGYQAEHPLRGEELAAVFPLAMLRLCMSACIAAWQRAQRPDDEYLAISQAPIQRTLPRLQKVTTEEWNAALAPE